jgi:hypothetical protein
MPDLNKDDPSVNEDPSSKTETTPDVVVPPDVEEIVQKKIAEALKPIKSNLDKAYEARDAALAKVKEFEKKQREEELLKLQEAGKHKEAYELQLAEEKRLREAAEAKAVELTRDMTLRSALNILKFRSANANEMAFREIVPQLVKDANGNWVHRSGVSIQDFVQSFADNQDNAFLFTQRVSTGSGSSTVTPSQSSSKGKSLFEMTQEEVLQMAREGKIQRR